MNNTNVYIIILLFILIIIFIIPIFTSKKEKYGFAIGALGDYQKQYYQCISECEREDSAKFMGKTHGSWNCDLFCNSKYTQLAKEARKYLNPMSIAINGPASECQLSPSSTRQEQCYQQCGYNEEGR